MIDLAKTPSFRLDGKRALVTGGGRGIGLAAASALAQAGAHVTLAARTQREIEDAAQAIRARGDKAGVLQLQQDVLEEVERDLLRVRDPLPLDGAVACDCELDRGAHGVVDLRGNTHRWDSRAASRGSARTGMSS